MRETKLWAWSLPFVALWRRVRAGHLRLADLTYGKPRFSQFGEDVILGSIFHDQDAGFYVDVGSYHPIYSSNTYELYRRGWRGINIDARPGSAALFDRRRPRDINLEVAVSETAASVPFRVYRSFSGIVDENYDEQPERGHLIRVPSEPLSEIFDKHVPPGTTIDLLDVDCEGHDLAVLKTNDWERYRPRVILAEWQGDDTKVSISSFLEDKGYRLSTVLHLTGIFTLETAV